ncbi:hypothetical protein OC835_001788 [Tilletia horrida]|nr:hypothetical protein OC835_001788 [Tilletia horrida]
MANPAFQLWTVHQSTSQATVLFYVPRQTRSADLDVRITRDSITAGLRNQPPIINASLWAEVHPHSSSWQIERAPRKHRKSSRSRSKRHSATSSPPLHPDSAQGAISPRLSSGPPSTAYSIIGDSAPGSHGVRSLSDADSGSESEADAAASSNGYISQPEDGSQPRRRLPRFDPSATRSFSSRAKIVSAAQHGASSAAMRSGPEGGALCADLTASNAGSDVDLPRGQDGGLASSVASLPARLRPAAPHTISLGSQQETCTSASSASAAASRLASRSASTTSFSSLGSASFDMDMATSGARGAGAIASSTSSLSSDIRRARSIQGTGEAEDLTQSQDSFLSIGRPSSGFSDEPRVTSEPQPTSIDVHGAAEPTPPAERAVDELIPGSYRTVVERPTVQQSRSHDSGESRSLSGSGSGSGPSSNLSGSLVLPATANASGPASTSAASTSSGVSVSSLAGARLVTIYLEKVQPGIWPVLISGPAPLPDEAPTEGSKPRLDAAEARLPLLNEEHARNSLRVALQEALDEARSSASSFHSDSHAEERQSRTFGHRRGSEAGHSSVFTVASDDSDTVLGPRYSTSSQTAEQEGADNVGTGGADAESTAERHRRAQERQLCAKYNLDATSLVLLGLQSRVQLGERPEGVDDAFHYFVRAWRAALSPVATCRLVEDYLPLKKPRAHSSEVHSEPESEELKNATGTADRPVEDAVPKQSADGSSTAVVSSSPAVAMDRRQQSSDTLRSPRSGSQAGTSSPVANRAGLQSDHADARRDSLISLLGGSNALGRLYLSYARLHLETAIEKWTSPLAFPSEAGQLHGPFTSSTAVLGASSPVALSAGVGGGSSPGVTFHGVSVSPHGHFATGAGLGLGPSSVRGGGEAGQCDGVAADVIRYRGAFGPVTLATSARSPSSAQSGRSGSVSPNPHQGLMLPGSSLNTSDQTSILLFASHERERTLRRYPGPLAYMQAAVRLDPTLATTTLSSSSNEQSPCRPYAMLPGENEAQAWRMPMSIEEDEWTEAHELEVERRTAIHHEARYRASLTGEPPSSSSGAGPSWRLGRRTGSDGSPTGTATPTTSSVPSSEVGGPRPAAGGSGSRRHSQYGTGTGSGGVGPDFPPSSRRGSHKSAQGGPSSSRRKTHSSRRHGRSSMRRPHSTLPLISEEGMINIVSGAAVLSVVVAGSVAVMGWWRRAGGGTGPGV